MGLLTQNMHYIITTKNCLKCNRDFPITNQCGIKERVNKKYCSLKCKYEARKGIATWNKGKKGLQVAWNKGKSDYAKKLGFGKWMTGKKLSVETRRKQSEATQKRIDSGLHNFYIDGRTPERMVIRHSLDYKLWREAVFKRDNYTCQECGERGCYLEAHHKKSFALFPELRFAIDNGVTLCTPCHAKLDILRARTLKKQI